MVIVLVCLIVLERLHPEPLMHAATPGARHRWSSCQMMI
jgi:hypothetical protein